MDKGLVVVYTGASGVGKGTVLREVLASNDNLRFSVSATTRAPRPGEIDGVQYHFVSVDKFEKMLADGELLEHTVYCDNYYGTPAQSVHDSINKGYDTVLEIEVEGYLQIKKLFPDCLTIFVLPPSLEELERRLSNRGTESKEVVRQRLERAVVEMGYADQFDYQVVNDDIDRAKNEILEIIAKTKAERN